MKITIATNVATYYQDVFKKFDLELFEALKPPLVKLNVQRFDGCLTGDQVHLKINLFGQENIWVSDIVDHQMNDQEIYFIDEGKELPAPLAYWRHKHRIIRRTSNKSTIIDEIEYRTHSKVVEASIYAGLYAQFWWRKPVYRRFFGKA